MTVEEELFKLLYKDSRPLKHADPRINRSIESLYEALKFLARRIDELKK